MEKSCQSSGDSTITNGSNASTNVNSTNGRDQYLKQLNKFSHKISKPFVSAAKKLPLDREFNHTPPPLQPPQSQSLAAQPQQPPVYNINKNDFRDVVQKLTGSPAHDRFSTPPPIQPPKPQSSRLQRIRPPPLAHVSNRPPPFLHSAMPPHQRPPLNTGINPVQAAAPANNFIQRPPAPLSPLPPFPAVHAAAESPVSAYMRFLQNSISNVDSNKHFSGFSPLAPLVSPSWNNLASPQQQQNQQQFPPPQQGAFPSRTSGTITSQPQFQFPTSPLPFGCLNSPRSPYPLLSPSSFPLSPTVPVPSPRWRGV